MTKAIENIEELFTNPDRDPVAEFRAQGLLPSETTDRSYTPQAVQAPAGAVALAQTSPRAPFIAGRAQMSVSGPQWFIAGDTAEIGFRWNPGTFFGSIVWFDFRNLGANRDLLAWIELRVNPPGPTTFRIAGSGNPTSILISNQGTGGQRMIVPLVLKSGADGRAIAYVTPTEPGFGGAWYSTTLFGF